MSAASRLVFIPFLLSLGACGSPLLRYQQATATAAVAIAAAYRSLDAYDTNKINGITERANKGDKAGAQSELDEWLPRYKSARLSLGAAAAVVEIAPAAQDVIAAAANKEAEAAKWLAILAKAVISASSALAPYGIKLPGVP